MKVYLVITEDRHCDVQVDVYATAEAALEQARRIAEEYKFTPEDPDTLSEPWLFTALSTGGDCVHVEEAEVNS